jgi:class 3 adenylate cyclase
MTEARAERRLAAILAADIAGYSRLMGVDEEGTLARLHAHRREFLESTITEHRGRNVKRTGDGILIEFFGAVDTTCCAISRSAGWRNALPVFQTNSALKSVSASTLPLKMMVISPEMGST